MRENQPQVQIFSIWTQLKSAPYSQGQLKMGCLNSLSTINIDVDVFFADKDILVDQRS